MSQGLVATRERVATMSLGAGVLPSFGIVAVREHVGIGAYVVVLGLL